MEYMENDREHVFAAKRRALLDLWIEGLIYPLNLQKSGRKPCWLLKTGGRYLRTGKVCKAQIGHNDFTTISGGSPGYFFIMTVKSNTTLCVCEGPYKYVFYSTKAKPALSHHLKVEAIVITSYSVFVGHSHVKHARDEEEGDSCLR